MIKLGMSVDNLESRILLTLSSSVQIDISTYFTGYITNGGEVVNEIVNAVYCPTNSIGAENIIFNNISNLSTNNDEAVVTYFFNEDGPVFGENGEYELDPDNDQCRDNRGRLVRLPVFGTCKNNCKGGKLK